MKKERARRVRGGRLVRLSIVLGALALAGGGWRLLDAHRATTGGSSRGLDLSSQGELPSTLINDDLSSAAEPTRESDSSLDAAAARKQAIAMMSAMPMVFEENLGQWDVPAKLVGRGHGMLAAMEPRAIRLALMGKNASGKRGVIGIRLDFADASAAGPIGADRLLSHRNYYLGNDSSKWQTNVSVFGGVSYPDLYPGVSLSVGNPRSGLEYDLHVASAECLDAVRVDCEGIRSLRINSAGELELETEIGILQQSLPKAWFVARDGGERPADCRFRLSGPTSYGFSVTNPQTDCALVVDPGLAWSTFLGGTLNDMVQAIDLVSGLVTVAGSTYSTNFPLSMGPFQPIPGGLEDAFVTRLNPALTGAAQLVWSTYLGGSNNSDPTMAENAKGVSVNASGDVAICGVTGSRNFPVTASAYQPLPAFMGSQENAFITKLASTGAMSYSTYYGGNIGNAPPGSGMPTTARAVFMSSAGLITVAGGTGCTDLPLVSPEETAILVGSNDVDGWVAQFDSTKSGTASLVYSTYVTGSWYDEIFALDVKSGLIYVGGSTTSPDFVTHAAGTTVFPLQPTPISATGGSGALLDGFIRVIDPSKLGTAQLFYSTYLGSTLTDELLGLVVDSKGNIHCCGLSTRAYGSAGGATGGFPVSTVNDLTNAFNGGEADFYDGASAQAFLVKVNPVDPIQQLKYGTLFDGSGLGSTAMAIVSITDTQDVIVGSTVSPTLPVTSGAIQTILLGTQDAFLARLDWSPGILPVNQLTYCTYLGGSASDDTATCIVMAGQDAYIGGFTTSTNFPTTLGAFQMNHGGLSANRDGFALKLQLPAVGH